MGNRWIASVALGLSVLGLACGEDLSAADPTMQSAELAGTVVHLRMQAGFPILPAHPDSSLDSALALLLDVFERWAERAENLSGGSLDIEIVPCCGLAATNVLHQAVGLGVGADSQPLHGAQGIAAYLYNTTSRLRRTAGLFGGGFHELDSEAMLAWMEQGGGNELYAELMEALGYDVVVIPYGPVVSQNLGWFPDPLTGPGDLEGLRYRIAGMANEMAVELGMVSVNVGAGGLVTALSNGQLDAAEFNSPGSDLALGLHSATQPAPCTDGDCRFIYYLGGLGQVAEWIDLIINRDVWESLTNRQRWAIERAARIESAVFPGRVRAADARALQILSAQVEVLPIPQNIVEAQREAWDAVIDCDDADPDDLFCRVVDSIEAFAASSPN